MVRWLRAGGFRKGGRDVEVRAVDSDWAAAVAGGSMGGRDRAVADNLIAVRREGPEAVLIALTGRVHARVACGASWDDGFEPMGWHIARAARGRGEPEGGVSRGETWVITDRGTGPQAVSGEDRGDEPFVRPSGDAAGGWHGVLSVGRVSAAPPALVVGGE